MDNFLKLNIILRREQYTGSTIRLTNGLRGFTSMSIFTDTMVEAIRKYRAMLRKHLPQAQRVNHLHQLDLKNPRLYSNEVMLYQLGYKIIDHLHQLDNTKNGYYSYSGVSQFASHLQKFLDKYKLDDDQERVLHTSQLASRYLLKITQIMALSNNENPA